MGHIKTGRPHHEGGRMRSSLTSARRPRARARAPGLGQRHDVVEVHARRARQGHGVILAVPTTGRRVARTVHGDGRAVALEDHLARVAVARDGDPVRNRSREYPVIEPSLRTVRALSSDWAVVLLGMLGGVAEAVCAKAADSAVAARTATQRRRVKTRTSDTGPPEGRRRGGLPAGSCRAACAIL
jgi:hypothetical protein